jgi:uncharacterized membrane protein
MLVLANLGVSRLPGGLLVSVASVATGLPVLVFIPGFLFLDALFPRSRMHQELSFAERLVLSCATSIAILVLVCIVLNYTPWGISSDSVLGILFLLSSLFAAAAFFRADSQASYAFLRSLGAPKNLRWIAPCAALSAAVLLLPFFPVPAPLATTQFYVTNPEGVAANYGTVVVRNGSMPLLLGIVNQEGVQTRYTVHIMEEPMELASSGVNFTATPQGQNVSAGTLGANLAPGEVWQQPYSVIFAEKGFFRVVFALDRSGGPSAYRTLYLWADFH